MTVVTGSFTRGKAVWQLRKIEKSSEHNRRCSKWMQFAQISNVVWNPELQLNRWWWHHNHKPLLNHDQIASCEWRLSEKSLTPTDVYTIITLDTQLTSLYTIWHNQLLATRNCILILCSWAKRIMFNVFYMDGKWILSERYKFYYLSTTLIFYIHNLMMLKIIILKKKGITDKSFHLLMIILEHCWILYCTEMGK